MTKINITFSQGNKFSIVDEEKLKALLEESEILAENDTLISDKIRLLKFDNNLFIQEKSDRDEYLIRKINSAEEADEFIKSRMEIYDRMWDGCGCKVDYYS